ncbi:MAG: Mur ligase domain-containing protein [Clostridiales bacterium]|nr:MAG: Mur ligase domain-containing protein [Clostridiales bacterium]
MAIRGYKTDGHKYIEQAVKNGAAAVIAEEHTEKHQGLRDYRRQYKARAVTHFGNVLRRACKKNETHRCDGYKRQNHHNLPCKIGARIYRA